MQEKLAEEEAKQKLEELKLRGKDYRDEASRGAYHETRDEGERYVYLLVDIMLLD